MGDFVVMSLMLDADVFVLFTISMVCLPILVIVLLIAIGIMVLEAVIANLVDPMVFVVDLNSLFVETVLLYVLLES